MAWIERMIGAINSEDFSNIQKATIGMKKLRQPSYISWLMTRMCRKEDFAVISAWSILLPLDLQLDQTVSTVDKDIRLDTCNTQT